MIGKVQPGVASLAPYRPGKAASEVEAEHGIEDAIKLASNESPWPPVPAIREAIVSAAAGVNRYGDNNATAVVDSLSTWLGVDAERITVGPGSSGILQQLFITYAGVGTEVLMPWPSFELYPVYSTIFGAEQVRAPLRGLEIDLDAVASRVTDATSLVLLATPNNPTGASLDMAEVAAFVDQISDDVIVVIDEAYREFNNPALGDPVEDLQPGRPNVVVTRTFSKAFGLAGLRAGYCVAHSDVVEQLNKVRTPFSMNNLTQAAILAAVEHVDEALEQVAKLIAERERCVGELRSAGLEVPISGANFLFLPTGGRTNELAVKLEQRGIVTRPFAGFGLRITIGTPEQNDRWVGGLLELLDS